MKRRRSERRQRREALYGLGGIRLDAYDAVVRPDRVFPVRLYTLRRWAPILGATGFWLLVTMQQLCYRNPRGSDWCTISRAKLAEKAGVSEATVQRYLRSDRYGSGLQHWIRTVRKHTRRWSSRAGRYVQPPNRYHVVMDAPLAPVDQRGLAQLLQDRGAVPGTPAKAVEPMLQELAALSLPDLMALCEEAADRFSAPVNWDEKAAYPTVARVMTTLDLKMPAQGEAADAFRKRCSQLQQAFVGRTYLKTQYFRRQWLPLLGQKLALAVVQLRSRCFWNQDEARDEVALPFTALAREAGCSARWLRTINETHPRSRAFFRTEARGRGKRPVFRVTLLEPIAPQDEEHHTALLRAGAVVPETGQLDLPTPVSLSEGDHTSGRLRTEPVQGVGSGNGTGERLRTESAAESAPENGTDEHLRTEAVNASNSQNGMDGRVRTEPVNPRNGTGERHVSTLITVTNTYDKRTVKQQHAPPSPAAAVRLLLEDFGIGPPNDRRILNADLKPETVRAWMLYAVTEPGFQDPGTACGYVVNRLLAGDDPPERFLCWAELSPEAWRALWRAGHYGGPYVARAKALLSDSQRLRKMGWSADEALDAWQGDLGGVFSRGPFGHGHVDLAMLEELVRERVSLAANFWLKQRGCTLEAQSDSDEAYEKLVGAKEELQQLLERQGVFHRLTVARRDVADNSARARETNDAAEMWQRILAQLELQLTRATFASLLQESQGVDCREGVLTVAVPNHRAKDWLEARLMPMIKRTVGRMVEAGAKAERVCFVVEEGQSDERAVPDDKQLAQRPGLEEPLLDTAEVILNDAGRRAA